MVREEIRRYEHRRWTEDDNRRGAPVRLGTRARRIKQQRLGYGPALSLGSWAEHTVAHSDEWFHAEPAADYVLHPPENGARAEIRARAENGGHGDRVLTFSSAVDSPWPENNRVHARLFAVSNSGPAVVVLPHGMPNGTCR